MSLAALALGAALLYAPEPPVRPAIAAKPDQGLEQLLGDVRQIYGSPPAPQPTEAPAEPAASAPDAAPETAPYPPRRGERQGAHRPPFDPRGIRLASAGGTILLAEAIVTLATAPLTAPLPPRTRRRSTEQPQPDDDDSDDLAFQGPDPPTQPEREPPAMAPPVKPAIAPRPQKHLICRDPRLSGTPMPQIVHASWPCGIAQPVRVTAVSGISLTTPATLDCNTATRFATWLTGVVGLSAREHLGSDPAKVRIMGSYVCRTRNHKVGGKLSEHARGRAVDIGGFTLKDGREISILKDWGKGPEGKFLSQIRSRACGLFQTVLGPGSDRHHANHFHFDTSPRSREPYCR